jgi:oxalate---CoA ligase
MLSTSNVDQFRDLGAPASVWSALRALAAQFGGHDAILAPGRRALTFAALRDRIFALKDGLNRAGIGRGDRVAIVLPNGAEMAVCCVGTVACAVAAPLNPSYTADELRVYFARLRPKALITLRGYEGPVREVAKEFRVRVLDLEPEISSSAGTFTLSGGPLTTCGDPGWNTEDDLAYIVLTSGTTSQQKLVPVKQKQLLAYASGVRTFLEVGPADRTLLVMPLFHGAGLKSSCLIPLVNGCSLVCLPEFEVPAFYEAMDAFRPTWITAGYAFQKAILERAGEYHDIVQRSRLRFIRSGSGRLDPEVKAGLESVFGAPVIDVYSSSETGAIASSPMPPDKPKPGTVGHPMFNEVAIMRADGTLLGPDTEGEIVVRGPSVFEGYLDDPEANKAAFSDGWYRTGDLGRLDEDGFLTITGRAKEVINRGGEKISPREIETVIARHEAVLDVKAFGVPHASLGEEVVAAVVVRSGAPVAEEDLKGLAVKHLAGFKVPRRIFFRDAFPLGPTGKLDVRALIRDCQDILDADRRGTQGALSRDASATESAVCDLWREVLGEARVGTESDFSLLGGDSLKAVELLVSVERVFEVQLPAHALDGVASTVAKMAAEIDRLRDRQRIDCTGNAKAVAAESDRAASSSRETRPLLSASDVLDSLTLLGLAPVAWCLPRAAWSRVCAAIARTHILTRGSHAHAIDAALEELGVDLTSRELERQFFSGVYEDIVCTLREQLPFDGLPPICLIGEEHVGAARAAGRGAILWTCPSPFGGLMAKKALKAAGFDLVNLRSIIHPYSNTWFGMNVLNPIRTRVEDRYLLGTVALWDGEGLAGFQELRRHLDVNAVVTIAANAQEGVPYEMPFLGGTLGLSLGAPMLAALHDAPLLPVFTSVDESGGFEIVVGPRIQVAPRGGPGETARALAQKYAGALADHLRRHPVAWRGWFSRSIWRPSVESGR